MSLTEIEELLKLDKPRDAKMKTAYEIVKIFHGEKEALLAQETFIKKVQKKEAPDDILEVKIGSESETIFNILKKCLTDKSKSDIKRLIEQGAVRIDGQVYTDLESLIKLNKDGLNLNVGKRLWLKIKR